MKKTLKAISWTFACLLAAAGADAQDTPAQPAASGQAAPAVVVGGPPEQVKDEHAGHDHAPAAEPVQANGLAFDTLDLDFGTAEEGTLVNIEFPFKNVSGKTITVSSVKATCGCTAADLQKKVFAPGEGDVIKGTFNSKGRTGSQHKAITVTTDESETATYRLNFHGEVVSQVFLEPKMLNFGEIMQGAEKSMAFELFDYTDKAIEVQSLTSSAAGLKTEFGAAVEAVDANGRKGRKIPITVTVPADFPVGPIATTVAVQTNNAERPSFVGSVRGTVRGEVSVQPAQVYFGFVSPTESATRRIGVTVQENKKFEMTGFEIKADAARTVGEAETPKVEVVADAAGAAGPTEQNFTVTLTAPEKTGRYAGEIVLKGTVDGAEKSVSLPYNAFVRSTPAAGAGAPTLQQQQQSAVPGAANPETRERVQAILRQNEEAQKARLDAMKKEAEGAAKEAPAATDAAAKAPASN